MPEPLLLAHDANTHQHTGANKQIPLLQTSTTLWYIYVYICRQVLTAVIVTIRSHKGVWTGFESQAVLLTSILNWEYLEFWKKATSAFATSCRSFLLTEQSISNSHRSKPRLTHRVIIESIIIYVTNNRSYVLIPIFSEQLFCFPDTLENKPEVQLLWSMYASHYSFFFLSAYI